MGALLRVAGHRRPGSRQLLAGKPLGLAKAFETKGMSVFAGRPPYGRGHHGKRRPRSVFATPGELVIRRFRRRRLHRSHHAVESRYPSCKLMWGSHILTILTPPGNLKARFFHQCPMRQGATEHHGSWCERWRTWLEHRCGALKPSKSARQPKASGSREGSRNIRSQLGKE